MKPAKQSNRSAAPSVLSQLACALGRRDEIPNKELAQRVAATRDRVAIRQLAEGLSSTTSGVAADCIKVLYEIGELDPHLIAPHVALFRALLKHPNNRMVWGGMTALNAVATIRAAELFKFRGDIVAAIESGSVITCDNGIAALSKVAAASVAYRRALMPTLIAHLKACRPKDVASRAEKLAAAVGPGANRCWLTTRAECSGRVSRPQGGGLSPRGTLTSKAFPVAEPLGLR